MCLGLVNYVNAFAIDRCQWEARLFLFNLPVHTRSGREYQVAAHLAFCFSSPVAPGKSPGFLVRHPGLPPGATMRPSSFIRSAGGLLPS